MMSIISRIAFGVMSGPRPLEWWEMSDPS